MFGLSFLVWSLMTVASASTCDIFAFLPSPQARVQQVRQYAFDAHKDRFYGHLPYSLHLEGIVDVLREFGFRDVEDPQVATLHMSAYIHDALESAYSVRSEHVMSLVSIAGSEVADVVVRLTDDKIPNAKGQMHGSNNYSKMRGHYPATVVKLAIHIAKVRFAQIHAREEFASYRAEYPGFRFHLYTPYTADDMWAELDRLLGY